MTNVQHTTTPSAVFADSKPHYALLDGLRGAAALMVVWYHFFEGFAFAEGTAITTFNHGHLGVDLFFMLSGFVISYAYDDRWQSSRNRLTLRDFFKRRLIRLHPMLIMGAVIGLITFWLQGGVQWDGTQSSFAWSMVALVAAMLFVPAYPNAPYDLRGNGEMYSLNGPSWSLFFEYIGNLLYALFIRRLGTRTLAALTTVLGVAWVWFVATDVSGYDMIGIGWTLDTVNFFGGLLRMMFPFTVGMLLARNFKPVKIKGIFWIAWAVLFALFSMPAFAKCGAVSLNGVYELACVVIVFPAIVWLAASGETTDKISSRVCQFLGDISYPLYIVHYPVMYLFYAWLIENQLYSLSATWPVVIMVFAINITLAYACLKLYDEPVRRWLTKRFINPTK
ncbi:MAG: acyltransferase [Rikenellaceae bacterium]|nr:acyltransferase [Rikenellaceae bacterium]